MENLSIPEQASSARDKSLMLCIARETLSHYLTTGQVLNYDESVLPGPLLAKKGVFVSLH
ncbi:MAG: AmmeMemoRadiSam system protein A, partial [Bacteroidales bacterium]|nr:AmmeMemoRadiSam system protein A [Bacteroidales bacterium]